MSKRSAGLVLLILGILSLVGAMVLFFSGFGSMLSNFKPVATLESPGSVVIEVEEAGSYLLWHDHRVTRGGSTVSHPSALPGGFNFSMTRDADGSAVPLTSSRVSTTMSMPDRESQGIGTFALPAPGSYTLRVEASGGQQRHFSLTKGEFLGGMAQFGIRILLAGLLGFLGLVLLIIGIVFMVLKPKAQSRTPQHQIPPPPPL